MTSRLPDNRRVHSPPTTEASWCASVQPPQLAADEVHVWRVVLDDLATGGRPAAGVLSPAEREQAQRFHFDKDRRQYVVSHTALREILGGYLATDPACLRFERSSRRKPELAPEFAPPQLRFNLSHTRGMALIAVTLQRDVGVDVEFVHRVVEAEPIAERFFSPAENVQLRRLPAGQRQQAFFTCWTRREAYLKATGEGIAESLDQLEVTFSPSEPARLVSVRGDRQAAAQWQLEALSPGPDYVAALAVRGQGLKVRQWDWGHGGGLA